MQIKVMLFGLCFLFFALTPPSFATELSEVFSKQYLRTDSSPNIEQDSFLVTPGAGLLFIENGIEGIRATMVSSAEVWVNDEQIFGPSDFGKNVSTLQEQINLFDINPIRVVLNSKPGSFLRVKVFAEGDDDSHSAPAYESKDSGEPIEQTDLQVQSTEVVTESISATCNAPEVGYPIPFPTTAVTLDGKFYVFTGETKDWIPPDPGEPGKTTIAGIDSDGDCVRDDIERFIARLFPSASHVKARKYMFEYAKWRGQFLKSPLSTVDAKEISRNLYRSAECVRRIVNDDAESRHTIDLVFAKFHDTFPRSYRYIDNNALLGGWSTREKTVVSCP